MPAPREPTPHLVPQTVSARATPQKRFALGFGPRFFMVLLVGLVWVGPGWWEPRFLWALLLWDLLALAAWAWDFRRLPRPERLEMRRVWNVAAALGTPSLVELELANGGCVALLAETVDDVPTALRAEPATVEINVAAKSAGRAAYSIAPVERGDARLGRVYLRYQSPLRLAERWAVADLSQIVRVYPSLEESKRQTIYLIRSRQVELEKRLKRQRGLGREFESLREYRQGDEWREVCWTATARRNHLITKVYQVERSQVVWIVVDAGRLLRARVSQPATASASPGATLTKLDFAVNAALSLARVALYSGDRVGLLAYGRKLQQRLAAGRGTAHLRALVEQLALVHTEPFEADHLRAAELLLATQKRRSLIVWLTDLAETPATPEVIESALQMTVRHLVLFGVISQPELAQLAWRFPETENEMYRHVAAQEMLHRRELLLRRLRQQGALAVEFEPGRLSTSLVNHYLEIKERSLL